MADHEVSRTSSGLNSAEPIISKRSLKLCCDFWGPWFQYQSPNNKDVLFGYGAKLVCGGVDDRGSSSEVVVAWLPLSK